MACGLEGLRAMNGMLPQGRARLVALATTIVPGVGWIAFFLLLPVVLVVLLGSPRKDSNSTALAEEFWNLIIIQMF